MSKFLSHYIQLDITHLNDELGAFYAFSKESFESSKVYGVTYVSMGNGLICPKKHAKTYKNRLNNIIEAGIKKDLSENGKKCIITRELHNHEAFYCGDIDTVVEVLDGYGFSVDEIKAVYDEVYKTIDFGFY
jgi:hypothetical protein